MRSFRRTLSAASSFLSASPARTAVISFAAVIMLGTLLLMLPVSSEQGTWTSPTDALFTATSAVCVTGLIVKQTPTYWSTFGELVVLTLIQAGGLGIMTVSAFLAVIVRRKLSISFEDMMTEIVESDHTETVWGLIRFICLFTLVAEAIGAVCLFLSWEQDAGFWHRVYISIFHAISAFCNAGFSLYNDSLVRYSTSIPVNAIICTLIVVGGIGFLVVRDIKHYVHWFLFVGKGKRPKLSTHSKLVLMVTALLLVSAAACIFIMESSGDMADAPLKERLLTSIFQSVTPRTAGFNTVEISAQSMAASTAFLLIVLMFIGGSPGSTAGGIKTSTLGVMISSIIATLKARTKAEMFHHSIQEETVHRVASIILLSAAALLAGIFLLLITEAHHASFLEIAFEATSAFGTVGLSMGLTFDLTHWGKLIITALMFIGRLGPVTLVLSVGAMEDKTPYRYPDGQVWVG